MMVKKEIKVKKASVLQALQTAILTFMVAYASVPVFASDTGIFSAVNNNIGTIIEELVVFFDTTIFPILLLCLFISMGFFSSNDRALGPLKTGLKWLLFVFVGVNCLNLILKTLVWIVELFNG